MESLKTHTFALNLFSTGSQGVCIEAGPGEEGELVAKIIRGDPVKDFQGYGNNRDETEKKILRDVFRKGDAYFRSGDLVTMDKFGWIFFKDRCGDTFRSKFITNFALN